MYYTLERMLSLMLALKILNSFSVRCQSHIIYIIWILYVYIYIIYTLLFCIIILYYYSVLSLMNKFLFLNHFLRENHFWPFSNFRSNFHKNKKQNHVEPNTPFDPFENRDKNQFSRPYPTISDHIRHFFSPDFRPNLRPNFFRPNSIYHEKYMPK